MPSYRTTAEKVRGIIDADPSVDLTPFLESANLLVTEKCAPAGYSPARLEMIERWLAAHFYRVDVDPSLAEEQVGSGRWRTDALKVELGLNMTRPGQQVMYFDDKRTLSQTVPTDVNWLGTSRCDT